MVHRNRPARVFVSATWHMDSITVLLVHVINGVCVRMPV